MTRFPALERLLEIPVRRSRVLGNRDPLLPGDERVMEVGRRSPARHRRMITGAAHAVNFSHPGELAHVIRSWLDGVEIVDDPDQPGLTSVLVVPRD